MRSLLSLLSLILFTYHSYCQYPPSIISQQCYGGSNQEISPTKLIPISNNNEKFLLASNSSSEDGDVNDHHSSPPALNDDIWISLIINQKKIWSKSYGGTGFETFKSIEKLSDGIAIVAGSSTSRNGDVTGNHGDADGWLFKIDSTGTVLWQKCYGGSGYDEINSVYPTSDGGYVCVGTSSSTNGDLLNISAGGGNQLWIFKTDNNGNLIWSKIYGGLDDESGMVVKPAIDGGFIIASNTHSSDVFVPASHGRWEIWVLKIDDLGKKMWEYSYGGLWDERVSDIEALPDGTFLVAGYSSSSDGNVTSYHGNADAWCFKLGRIGSVIWSKSFGGTQEDIFRDILPLKNGNIILVGNTRSNDDQVKSNYGDADAWIVNLNSAGNLQWEKNFGGSGEDYFSNIYLLDDNKMLAVGGTSSRNRDVSGVHGNGSYSDVWYVQLANSSLIKGLVFFDNNRNGIRDAGETTSEGVVVSATKNGYISKTITNRGIFEIKTDTGNYVVNASLAYYITVPVSKNTVFKSYFQVDSFSFALQPIPDKQDLTITTYPLGDARPGFITSYKITYKNVGTTAINSGEIYFIKDSRLSFISSSIAVTSVYSDSLTWSYTNLNPGDMASIIVNLKLKEPPILNNGDTLRIKSGIYPTQGDETPGDNISNIKHLVTNSFDPNDKYESNGGIISKDFIANGDYLNYVIRFQNTGTATAYTVKISDTLNKYLDLSSLQMVSSSHPYVLSIDNDSKLTWIFNNINLLTSSVNDSASQGYIAYRIKAKPSFSIGDTIYNTASIYFDFNIPIQTNTTTTTTIQSGNIVLPLKLISFVGKYLEGKSLLAWTTQNEKDFDSFLIERSINGTDYIVVGTLNSSGSPGSIVKYKFNDELKNVQSRIYYYRLKMLNKNGIVSYSKVVILYAAQVTDQLSVYPNPVRSNIATIIVEASSDGDSEFILIDFNGNVVIRMNQKIYKGSNSIQLKGLELVASGTYTLRYKAGINIQSRKITIIR